MCDAIYSNLTGLLFTTRIGRENSFGYNCLTCLQCLYVSDCRKYAGNKWIHSIDQYVHQISVLRRMRLVFCFEGIYLTAVMAMTSVSVMMTVFVLNLHYRGPKKNEIPFWMQQLLSLSLTNVIRTFSKSKKFRFPGKSEKKKVSQPPKKNSCELNQHRKVSNLVSTNGVPFSYTHVNETKTPIRLTTDVSKPSIRLGLQWCFASPRRIRCKSTRVI